MQKVDCILWLAQLKSYARVRRKFNQVCPNQTAPIYRSAMCWDKLLEETGNSYVMFPWEQFSSQMVHHLTSLTVSVPFWTGSFLVVE
jgi:hypothetical protein